MRTALALEKGRHSFPLVTQDITSNLKVHSANTVRTKLWLAEQLSKHPRK